MSIEEYRALIDSYLDSQGYIGDAKKSMRKNSKSYLNQLLEFMQGNNYEEISSQVISKYIKSKEGTSQLGARKLRCEEFAEYVKGERQISMIEATENEVAGDTGAITETESAGVENEVTTDMSLSHETEPPTAENEAVQNDSDMAMNQETETPEPVQSEANIENEPERMNESVQNEPVQAETPKVLGRPRKAAGDKRANSFSVYLNAETAEALRDLAAYERKEVSVLLAEQIEKFISRNEQALMDYRIFQKNKIPLQ